MERITGVTPPELADLPQCPPGAEHIWDWFQQLNGKRTFGMTLNPITWHDIYAWSQLTGTKPKQWELDAISRLDVTFTNVVTKE